MLYVDESPASCHPGESLKRIVASCGGGGGVCVCLHACVCGSVCLCTLPPDAPLNPKIYEDFRVHLKMIIGLTAFLFCFFFVLIFCFHSVGFVLNSSLIASPPNAFPSITRARHVFIVRTPRPIYIHIQSPRTFVHDGHPSLFKLYFSLVYIFL